MNSLWPSKAANDVGEGSRGAVDVADTGLAAESTDAASPSPNNAASARPGLQRNQTPNPPSQPPPPPGNQPPDSLSLAQLRRIVSEFPRNEAAAYDFEYSDTGPHAEEIDEWFVYQFWQWVRLNAAQRAFESHWEQEMGAENEYLTWDDASEEIRSQFVLKALDQIRSGDDGERVPAIGKIAYIVCGRWSDTAVASPFGDKSKLRTAATPGQLAAMRSGIILLAELGGLPTIWTALQDAFEALWYGSVQLPVPASTILTANAG